MNTSNSSRSNVINHLISVCNNIETGVAWIYFHSADIDDHKPENILASLLRQLFCKRSKASNNARGLYEYRHSKDTRPDSEALQESLRTEILKFGRVYIVADGLDEMSPDYQAATIKLLLSLDISLFATARYPQSIENEFKRVLKIDMASSSDLHDFISAQLWSTPHLNRLVKKDSNLRQEIERDVESRSQGVYVHSRAQDISDMVIRFFMALLYIERLRSRPSLREIRQMLRQQPETLDKLYDEAFERIIFQINVQATLAKSVLHWLMDVKRPLKMIELQDALAVQFDDNYLDPEQRPEEAYILSACTGLVVVHPATKEIQFAREYWPPSSPSEACQFMW